MVRLRLLHPVWCLFVLVEALCYESVLQAERGKALGIVDGQKTHLDGSTTGERGEGVWVGGNGGRRVFRVS